jgi:hypothetical protein
VTVFHSKVAVLLHIRRGEVKILPEKKIVSLTLYEICAGTVSLKSFITSITSRCVTQSNIWWAGMIPTVKTDNIVTWNQAIIFYSSDFKHYSYRNAQLRDSVHSHASDSDLLCTNTVNETVPFCSPLSITSRIYTKSGFHQRLNWNVLLC